MIPNGTLHSTEQIRAKAHFHLDWPKYHSKLPHFVSFGPLEVYQSANHLAKAVWLFEVESLAVKLYKFVAGVKVYVEDLYTLTEVPGRVVGAFDQLGNPLLVAEYGTESTLWWYDPNLGQSVLTSLGAVKSPYIVFDYVWNPASGTSDLLVFYIKADGIWYRQQRDKYLIEYQIPNTAGAKKIINCSATFDYKLQLLYR